MTCLMGQGINSKFSEDTKLGRVTDTSEVCPSVQKDLNRAERKFINSAKENAESCTWKEQPHAPVHVESRTAGKQLYRKWPGNPGGH